MNAFDRIKTRARGTMTLTKSPFGPFTFTEIVFDDSRGDLWFSGRHTVSEQETTLFTLILPEKHGTFSGNFGPAPDAYGYYSGIAAGQRFRWYSESGEYEATYIQNIRHLTGTFHFLGKDSDSSAEAEFAGEFNIQDLIS